MKKSLFCIILILLLAAKLHQIQLPPQFLPHRHWSQQQHQNHHL